MLGGPARRRLGRNAQRFCGVGEGRLLAALGPQQSRRRGAGLVVYIVFLICLIITVVPLGALLKKLLAPLSRDRTLREKAYFAGPSGE